MIFTVVLAVVLGWQLSLNRYQPFPYWLTVVVLSVTGTLYTDILTDHPRAFRWPSVRGVFSAVLALVFGVWFAANARCPSTASPRCRANCSTGSPSWSRSLWVPRSVTGPLELTGWGPGKSRCCCRPD